MLRESNYDLTHPYTKNLVFLQFRNTVEDNNKNPDNNQFILDFFWAAQQKPERKEKIIQRNVNILISVWAEENNVPLPLVAEDCSSDIKSVKKHKFKTKS